MDRRTDGGDNNIPFAFFKKRGDNKVLRHHHSWLARQYLQTNSNVI